MKRLPIQMARSMGFGLLVGAAALGCSTSSGGSDTYYDYCESIPREECYVIRRDPDSDQIKMAADIANRYIDNHPAEEELWDWKSGVLMHALAELYRVTQNDDFRDYYQSWLDYHIDQGYTLVWSDSCPPAITAVALLKDASLDATDQQKADYQTVVDRTLEYLDDVAPRTDEGGISHNGILGKKSVWLDSLFMFGMVLNRWGELAGNEARLDMMEEQALIFADVLQDENGFMRHAQDWPGYDESVYWARGNSWVVASLSDYLRIRVERDDQAPEVRSAFRRHVAAIAGAQDDETGLWWTVLDRPEVEDNYTETSASALFAYGMARAYRYGILGDGERRAAQKSVQRILDERVEDEGDGPVVTGVSLMTDPWSLEEYLAVSLGDDVNYGVGSVILALVETSGLPE